MSIPLADYQAERAAFDTLLNAECEKRVLLFQGESGTGKTLLLRSCRDRAKAGNAFYVNVDLKGTAVTIGEIFARISDRLGEARLETVKQTILTLQRTLSVDLEDIRQSGFGNQINISLQANDPGDRKQRYVEMTNALFADLRNLPEPVVFIFDTYQEATTEVQDWICGSFLARLESNPKVRLLVAGQIVPDENNLDWGYCCELHQLKGVPKPEHWLPVVQAMGLEVPGTDPLSWLNPICEILNGRPSDIMKYLKGYQERSPS